VRQSFVNLRPFLGIQPLDSTIGQGYMAQGYLIMLQITGDEQYKKKASSCLKWLMENKSPGYTEYSWGKHFDFASRSGRYPKFEPITIWTALIAKSFLEAYEILGNDKYLNVANSVCRWILDLPRNQNASGTCLGYTGSAWGNKCTIHNHNMYGAAILARTTKHLGNLDYLNLAKKIMNYSCSKQLSNGAWFYGEEKNQHWIDNFHTGYNLDSLKYYLENSDDNKFEENLRGGLKFYIENFFEKDGQPKYYHHRRYPIDSQCAAQAIETLANFSEFGEIYLDLAQRVAQWTINNMQDKTGYFYYRKYPMVKVKTPMLHWAQTTTYKALTLLRLKLSA